MYRKVYAEKIRINQNFLKEFRIRSSGHER